MELVYLWVEEYKNIKRQGFNFSPRFKCNYDYKTNGLTIDENVDYINIFPDYINITAIVGENGSGKSTLFKIILMILYYQYVKDLDRGDKFLSHELQKGFNNKKRINKKYLNKIFLIVNIDGVNKYVGISDKSIFKDIEYIENINFFTNYLNYLADSLYSEYDDKWLNELHYEDDFIYKHSLKSILVEKDKLKYKVSTFPNKYEVRKELDLKQNRGVINLDVEKDLLNEKILYLFSKTDNLIEFFSPNNVVFNISDILGAWPSKYNLPSSSILKLLGEMFENIISIKKWEYNEGAKKGRQ